MLEKYTSICEKKKMLDYFFYKMPSRCASWRNHTVSSLYSSMEPNLTVLTLTYTFILFLCHVTAVITVKTCSPVT